MTWTAAPRAAAGCAKVGVPIRHITSKEAVMGQITTVGIDLAKNVFSVHGVDAHGKTD
jgi:hypothetical protein